MSGHHHQHGDRRAGTEVAADLGPVSVLDIGGDIGAVVVVLDGCSPVPGDELFACPRGRPVQHFHTGIHLRPVPGGSAAVAVFPEVEAGSYSLYDHDTDTEHTPFDVTGGQVTQLRIG